MQCSNSSATDVISHRGGLAEGPKTASGSGKSLAFQGRDHDRSAPTRMAPVKSASASVAEDKSAPSSLAPTSWAPLNLAWFKGNVSETCMTDAGSVPGQTPGTGRMMRVGGQETVVAAFRHATSRNLDPALHTHAVIANMVRGGDDKRRSMAKERLYASKMVLGALYCSELAAGLACLA